MASAMTVVIVKYTNAFHPMRPTFPRSAIWAIPSVIVKNTMGATINFTRLMNVSPNGRSALPASGQKAPIAIPTATAMRTRAVRLRGRRIRQFTRTRRSRPHTTRR